METKFQLLLTLITLLKNTRHKNKKAELEFLMVNQTFNLVSYRQCIYWDYNGRRVSVKNASGLVQIDPDGPFTQWLSRVIDTLLPGEDVQQEAEDSYTRLIPIKKEDCPESERSEWDQWCASQALLLVMKDESGKIIGGLWLDREKPFAQLEKAMLVDLADGYAHALQGFSKKKSGNGLAAFSFLRFSGWGMRFFLLALLVFLLFPVRMSATAPAEIVASNPDTINIPFDGVIDEVSVLPGQPVEAGDVLFRMDSTVLENQAILAASELEAAQTALQKTQRESLTDREQLAEIAILQSQVAQKTAELSFAREMLERAEITAERSGIAIFSDPNALRGKPVQTGEQIMLLADPADNELLIRMPIDSMIRIEEDVPARFFLNVMPLSYEEAAYKSIGYQATPDPGGMLTYKIRAEMLDPSADLRIGWTGTGKVYGQWTILAFNILRRPIVSVRSRLGL
jgi:hypothetical protein